MRRHVNFWGGVKIASVHSILWITVFEYHLKYLIFGANSNRTFLVILKDYCTLGKTRNMTERDVFVWLGIVYFTYYFWPKSICALCYNRRRIMSKCGNVPNINKQPLKVILHFILCFWPITKFEVCSAISQRLLNKQNHLQVHSMHFHNVWKSLKNVSYDFSHS